MAQPCIICVNSAPKTIISDTLKKWNVTCHLVFQEEFLQSVFHQFSSFSNNTENLEETFFGGTQKEYSRKIEELQICFLFSKVDNLTQFDLFGFDL